MKYPLVFKDLHIEDYERVIEVTCEEVQLHAVIAIHQTLVGPALGGVRAFSYDSFDDALTDVLRLSKGMTYKAVLSGTGTGGGKSVIILPKGMTRPTEDILRAFGQAVDSLNGQYIAAEDMGVSVSDINIINQETPWVCGIESVSGDPSIYTAHGVFLCIKETAEQLWGSSSLKGRKIGIQGLGSVGRKLLHSLFFAGAELYVSDTNQAVLDEVTKFYGVTVVPVNAFPTLECDIFVPCAFGGVINRSNVYNLRCRAVVGAANNQLENPSLGAVLHAQGILYAPDYLANAGGLLNVALAVGKAYCPKTVLQKVSQLPLILKEIYQQSENTDQDTVILSDSIVEEKLTAYI
ncbi:Glu/Leu/Phe/Val dehydrogenase family protein [Chlamydia psittaci]|uniref:Glu/Leu/Phe/Val dehydrogenase family protein n=1 Tax=Chlamydia psittaci TaxID=83554 RepID=UPI00027E5E77|nr:Glu/Leu/Phe/Val dehydrogenase dimerization domain-containing protein [Chlamydia psittaci]AFS28407.1 leucine dehydrogenase [Chlamydia psittaci NJ1]KPZ36239.1 leucine dehydrogenase [Chlamydia psittaci NJ1]MDS0919429.1 Glu/Leu/Phe/Val dehydrogenase dimerization domain-containing protein [Chlamydia psittaci]MDS0989460.1 Glu/Leu/Phe/Val dehydrogenase dimerization domain-containing protein [Chlamydia psittaci]MDS0995435.1 Glu/Leu/Phe/Val dehydrogenase dimerization domain-containing protein [Chlam